MTTHSIPFKQIIFLTKNYETPATAVSTAESPISNEERDKMSTQKSLHGTSLLV
jgi:hypothetical protein